MDALLTYGGDRVGYSAMRSLRDAGARVAVADSSMVGMSQWSRFCWKKYLLDHPYTDTEAFVEDVARALKDSRARFLLPVSSETEVLAKHREMLPKEVVLPLMDYKTLHMTNDKWLMASFAKKVRVDVPDTIDWSSFEGLVESLKNVDFPLVVKMRRGYSARWVFYPENKGEVVKICRDLVNDYALEEGTLPMVQRRVKGEKWFVACLYHEGKRIGSFTQRMLRENPPTGGVSTLRISERNEIMESFAFRLLDALSWHGIAVVEFKYDPLLKKAWFIEINPRLWSAVAHAVASGVDLVALLYATFTKGPEIAKSMFRPQLKGILGRWWIGDANLAVSEMKRFKILNALKLLMPGGTDSYDEIWFDDPGAMAGVIARPIARRLTPRKEPQHTVQTIFLKLDS